METGWNPAVKDLAPRHAAEAGRAGRCMAGGADIRAVGRSIIVPGPDKDPRLRHMRYFVNARGVDAGVLSIKDLSGWKGSGEKGRILSTGTLNTCETFILNAALADQGVSTDKLEWIQFDGDVAKIQALKLDQVDLIGVHPPFYDAAEEAGLTQIGDSADANLGEATGVYLYYFSNGFIRDHPEEVGAFVRALTRAQQYANAHIEETARWTGEFIGQEVKGNHYYSETTKIDEVTVGPWVEDLKKNNLIPKDFKVTDLLTHQFESR